MNKEALPNMLDIFELASDDFPQSDTFNPKLGTLNYNKMNKLHPASDRPLIATRDSP
jgi:hypothetical protein